eukprot:scaffold21395_cov113-Isochrysis_galbana.AAC.6
MPSAPTSVATTGTPYLHASTILPLMPAPYRTGASRTRARASTSRLLAWPQMWKPWLGLCRACTLWLG